MQHQHCGDSTTNSAPSLPATTWRTVSSDDDWDGKFPGEALISRKRQHIDEASVRTTTSFMRKTARTSNLSWKCATCSLENLDALRCRGCGTRRAGRAERRDSITSLASSVHSYAIDDLVHNLEGLEVEINVENNNPQSSSRPSLTDTYSDSITSRLSSGNWSLRDLERWACSECTFENEPLACVCDMCGQSRSPVGRDSISLLESSRSNLEGESVRVLQERRLQELLRFRRSKPSPIPSDIPSLTAATAAVKISTPSSSRSKSRSPSSKRGLSPKPPRRPHSPKPPLGARAKKHVSPKTPSHRATSPMVPPRGSKTLTMASSMDGSGGSLMDSSLSEHDLFGSESSLLGGHRPSRGSRARKHVSPKRPSHRATSPMAPSRGKTLTMTSSMDGSGGSLMDSSLSERDLFNEGSLLNYRRKLDPQESNTTATTFDMSASMSTFDFSYPEQLIYPGIEEEEEAECGGIESR